jgi:hypothetical protein
MDYFTKYSEVCNVPYQKASTVTNVFFCRFAVPKELHCDQGLNFESQLL